MSTPRLSVTDEQGQRTVAIDKPVFSIGRRSTADLQVLWRDTSREHAQITEEHGQYVLRDAGSRFGTYVNGQALNAPVPLAHGDRIQLGRTSGVEIVFLTETDSTTDLRSATSTPGDFAQLAAVLNGLRALGSGRVLEEVLTLVVDSAVDVTHAERGFVMLAGAGGALEFRIARGRGHRTLAGTTFSTSTKIPREVFETGRSRFVGDLLAEGLANMHDGTIAAGIRHVLCVPLRVASFTGAPSVAADNRVIGVLYLDGHEREAMLASGTRSSLEAFATQAALAIESARLYAESAEKARLERDLRLAAEMQRALLPAPAFEAGTFDLAAVTLPCYTIGGDFFDYLEIGADFGFALGDVAGKGPSAALLAAAVQSNFVAQAPVASDPADAMTRINQALLRRAVEARFATMFYGALGQDGQLRCANAGQEPPLLVRKHDTRWLEAGGPVLGLLPQATYEYETVALEPGDLVIVCSDGVSEARNMDYDEFGRDRLLAAVAFAHGEAPGIVLDRVMAAVNTFAGPAPQADDITALVLRYRGPV